MRKRTTPLRAHVHALETLEPRQMLAAHPLDVGRFNSAAYTADGILCIAWYDPVAHNLKFDLRDTDGTWEAPTVIDDSADVGTYVSLAIDHNGQPAMAYYDATNADLKGAAFDGTNWNVATIDSVGRVGMYPSLSFDANNNANIAYYDRSHGDLKMANFDGNQWNFTTIDSAGDAGRYASLALSPVTGRWSVGYEENTQGLFRYAVKTKAGWSTSTVDQTRGGGGFISLGFSATGTPAMSYYDAFNADLKVANYTSRGWATRTVASKGSVGLYSNLLITPAGASVYYYNRTLNQVMRANSANYTAWTFATVETGGGQHLSATTNADQSIRSIVWLDTASDVLMEDDVS